MILILSNEIEQSTDDVIDWLISMGVTFIRINFNSFHKDYIVNDQVLKVDGKCILQSVFFREDLSLNEINFVWYRRLSSDLSNIYSTQSCMELPKTFTEQGQRK